MKNKYLKMAFAGLVLSTIGMSHAALITHNGYTLDTETNIVTGGGYEWLQWDVTVGQSINSALAANGVFDGINYGAGWTLASNIAVASLFTSFGFNSTTNENVSAVTQTPFTHVLDVNDDFIALFGHTYYNDEYPYFLADAALVYTAAHFGSDLDGDLRFNRVSVRSDSALCLVLSLICHTQDGYAYLQGDHLNGRYLMFSDTRYEDNGVALLRSVSSPVPEPYSVALFALGLGLVFRRRVLKQA